MVARATIESMEVHVNDLYMLLLSLSLYGGLKVRFLFF